jgi:transposase
MRGNDDSQERMFSYVSMEERIPSEHPLRAIRAMTNRALRRLDRRLEGLYSGIGRPSIAPEKLLRAHLLQHLYSLRSERMLMEQLDYNLLFRWFVGLEVDEAVWETTVFSKNRERLLEGQIADAFLKAVVAEMEERGLLSNEHFSVDGTLLEAWASEKSFQRKKEPPEGGSGARGKMLLNDVFESRSDPDARKFKKSQYGDAKLCHLGHALMDNRHGLVVAACVTEARTGMEREAAVPMIRKVRRKGNRISLGADKGYDDFRFVEQLRALQVTPHIAQYQRRTSSLDKRTTRHAGYWVSLKKRARLENIFGWIKNTAGLRKVKLRGRAKVDGLFKLAVAAYNLVRARKLMAQPG